MKKLSKREIILIACTLIGGLIALFIIYYYMPQKDKIAQLKQESQQLSLDIEDCKTKQMLLDATRNEVNEYKKQITDADEYLMESIDEPNILYYLSNIIYDTSEDQSVSYSPVEDKEVYVNKDISLSFNTSFENLIEILTSFEEGDIYTTLNEISISMNRDNNQYAMEYEQEDEQEDDEVSLSPLKVSYGIRFYATDSTWDGAAEYKFMKGGEYTKENIFE
ncbi:MAG: hypothetical protein QM217_06325 [Bacillota bacterium]|jgi:Tfp pilus assembly protein PilO|nr:hypothetical protein [Bacillota bacterium]